MAEIVLDGMSVLEDRRVVQRFRRVEVGPLAGDEEALGRIGTLLEESGAKRIDGLPPLFQALGLAAPVELEPPDASAPTADHIRAMMRAQLDAIRAHDPGTRLGTDPEDLHKMRTSVRRLRAILRAVRPVFAPEWGEDLRRELDWLGTALGTVRDLDVLLESLHGESSALEPEERVASRRLVGHLEAERAGARAELLTALDDPRYFALLDRLEETIALDPGPVAPVSLADIAAAEFKKLRKTVAKLPAGAERRRSARRANQGEAGALCRGDVAGGRRARGGAIRRRRPEGSRTSWASIRTPSSRRSASACCSKAPVAGAPRSSRVASSNDSAGAV